MSVSGISQIFTFLFVSAWLNSGTGVRINKLQVPEVIRHGNPVVLDCDFTLEDTDQELVVKWYFNNNKTPVYQWIQDMKPQGLGILKDRLNLEYKDGDYKNSVHRALHILKAGPDLSGDYTCSVSTLQSEDIRTKSMLVFAPEKSLQLRRLSAEEGHIRVQCLADGVFPKPVMSLHSQEREIEEPEVTARLRGQLYEVSATATLPALKDPEEFSCELRIPEANYTVRRETVFYPDLSVAGNMSGPILTLEQGKILGKSSADFEGREFFSFQGIPYAKSPTGNLRFKAPVPPEPWFGTFDATKEGNQCYSRHLIYKDKILGSEDCLVLNVYTPNLTSLKPVMLFIHGGAFTSGSGSAEFFGPEFLVAQDIVLVTINYRLGILGFFHLKDPSLKVFGNAGLKDQVTALRWVQKNIKSFGGDPNNVTIFGESAGAASVHYLVLSPLAKNLFHRAIVQSGVALNVFAKARYVALELAEALNLNTTDETQILDYLKKLSIQELHQASEKIASFTGYHALLPYAPTIEPKSDEAFIFEEPIKMMDSGEYNHVPLIFGYTSREGMLFEYFAKPAPISHPQNFEHMVPHLLGLARGSHESKSVAAKIKQFYYGQGESFESFYLIHGDNMLVREILLSARIHAQTSKAPVYLYRMSIETSLNWLKAFAQITNPGVCHGDDLGYLFKSKMTPEIKSGTKEMISLLRFIKLWTNFAKNGNPNPETEDALIPVKWKAVAGGQLNFLDIGEDLAMGVEPEAERMAFWKDIFRNCSIYNKFY